MGSDALSDIGIAEVCLEASSSTDLQYISLTHFMAYKMIPVTATSPISTFFIIISDIRYYIKQIKK